MFKSGIITFYLENLSHYMTLLYESTNRDFELSLRI